MLVSFLAYLAARIFAVWFCRDWRLLRAVALSSITCDLARLGLMLLPDAPVVIGFDSALCIVPSLAVVIACGGSPLVSLVLLGAPALVGLEQKTRSELIVSVAVMLQAYAAAVGFERETTSLVKSWDRRACAAIALCGLVAGVVSASWANANAASVMAYLMTCVLYLVQKRTK